VRFSRSRTPSGSIPESSPFVDHRQQATQLRERSSCLPPFGRLSPRRRVPPAVLRWRGGGVRNALSCPWACSAPSVQLSPTVRHDWLPAWQAGASGPCAAVWGGSGRSEGLLPPIRFMGFLAHFVSLAAVLAEAGADGPAFATQAQAGRDEVAAISRAAEAIGVFGVPSFIFNGELFWGSEHLRDIRTVLAT
jgi:hypothetical protein